MPYPAYAQATSPWVDTYPDGWREARFRHHAVINGGQVDPREQPWSDMVLVAPNHIESGTGKILAIESATEQGADSGKYTVDAGQVMYSKIRPALNKVATATEDCLCSADMYAMSFSEQMDVPFAVYFMLARPFHTFAAVTSMRVKMPKINREDLADAPWLVPPINDQRAIADYLDRETARVDTLIEEQQRLVEMLRERRQAVVESTVIDAPVETAGQRLKHIVLDVRQGWSPQCYPWPADGITTWGVLKAGAVNGGTFRAGENKELPVAETPRPDAVVKRGQLVVSRANTRELAGSAAVVDDDYPRLMLCDKLYGFLLDPERVVPSYVASILGTRQWRGLIELEATGSSPSMQNISQADILNLPMDLPGVDEQRRIVAYLDEQIAKIDALIAETEKFIELSRERRSALITAAVTGQIDVRAEVD